MMGATGLPGTIPTLVSLSQTTHNVIQSSNPISSLSTFTTLRDSTAPLFPFLVDSMNSLTLPPLVSAISSFTSS